VEPASGDPQYRRRAHPRPQHRLGGHGLHFLIDVLASLATLYAYRFCEHTWHRILVWLGLSLVVTFSTVNLVG
jgi:hypothetical protein